MTEKINETKGWFCDIINKIDNSSDQTDQEKK